MFQKLFAGLPVAGSSPSYTSSDGRLLTDAERQLLIENTERLIQQFETELKVELDRKATLGASKFTAIEPSPSVSRARSDDSHHAIEARAKEIVRANFGVNPDLAGWRGLVLEEIRRLRKEQT